MRQLEETATLIKLLSGMIDPKLQIVLSAMIHGKRVMLTKKEK